MLGIESVQSRCVWASQEYCVSRISKSSFHGKLSWRRGLVLDKIGKKQEHPWTVSGFFLDFGLFPSSVLVSGGIIVWYIMIMSPVNCSPNFMVIPLY